MTRTGRVRVPDRLFALRDQYVAVAGEIAHVAVEENSDPRKIDHVWITVRAGEFGRLQISLSTLSRQSRVAGFDPRVKLGVVSSTWTALPEPGVHVVPGLDYAELEAANVIPFIAHERSELEQSLVSRARRALFVEGWGEFYVRAHIGIHQVHSRRASLAVPQDIISRDGAVQFYFADHTREMLLFKFDGQP